MEGIATQAFAEDLDRSQANIQTWLNRFRAGGIDALHIKGNGSEFLFTPTLNKEWNLGFLRQIATHDPGAIRMIIGDEAGFHQKEDEDPVPEKFKIITLPAYRPELNPVEKLWDDVNDGICNRNWADPDELEKKRIGRIKPYWKAEKHLALRSTTATYSSN